MERICTVNKRNLFFEYLVLNGLSPENCASILEVAPNVILSQSALLVEKYAELYKQFLVSKKYVDGNAFGVQGVVGEVFVDSHGVTKIDCFRSERNNVFINGTILPNCNMFDTLLVQGQPCEAYSVVTSELNLFLGDVTEVGDRQIKNFYYDLLNNIRKYNPNGEDYDLSWTHVSKGGRAYYLIKRKSIR